jgi:hypothetical protein
MMILREAKPDFWFTLAKDKKNKCLTMSTFIQKSDRCKVDRFNLAMERKIRKPLGELGKRALHLALTMSEKQREP